MFEGLQDFTAPLPPWLQWAGVMLAGAIPFVESHFRSVIGVIAGLAAPVAVVAAVLGNVVSSLLWGVAFGTLAALGVDLPAVP